MTDPEGEIESTEGEPEDRTDWKAEARKWETRAKENAAAAKRLTALEEANKTAEQKASEARAQAERERDDARLALMKRDAADEAGLPRSWAERLRGATAEELLADAKNLAKDLGPKPPAATGGRPVANLQPGALPAGDSNAGPAGSSAAIDAYIRRAARRQ